MNPSPRRDHPAGPPSPRKTRLKIFIQSTYVKLASVGEPAPVGVRSGRPDPQILTRIEAPTGVGGAMNETQQSLLIRAQTGETDAWKGLTACIAPDPRWLNRQGVPAADLDDLGQEVLVSVVKQLPGFQHSGRGAPSAPGCVPSSAGARPITAGDRRRPPRPGAGAVPPPPPGARRSRQRAESAVG